jgi:4-carboxymuconolactone decarboxylase
MRLPLLAPADLRPERRPVYEDMRTGIEKNFQGFSTMWGRGILGYTSRNPKRRFGS